MLAKNLTMKHNLFSDLFSFKNPCINMITIRRKRNILPASLSNSKLKNQH